MTAGAKSRYALLLLISSAMLTAVLGTVAGESLWVVLLIGAAGWVIFASTFAAGTILPATSAILALLLLPRSLPALSIGRFMFGWGAGDVLVFGAFFIALSRTIFLRRRVQLSTLDKAVILYHISLLPSVFMTLFGRPNDAMLASGTYLKILEVPFVYFAIRLSERGQSSGKVPLSGFRLLSLGIVGASLIQLVAPNKYLELYNDLGAHSTVLSDQFVNSVGWRLAGPFFNSNTLGTFLIIALSVYVYDLASSRGRLAAWLLTGLAAAEGATLILAQSREAFVGLAIFLLYLLWTSTTTHAARNSIKWFMIPFAGICFALWPAIYHRVVAYTFGQGPTALASLRMADSTGARIDQWAAGIKGILHYGLFGAGVGQVAEAVGRFLPISSLAYGGIHQSFLRALLEGGISEFVGLLYLLSAIWRFARSLPAPQRTAIQSCLLAMVAIALFGDTFQNGEVMVPLVYVIALFQRSADSHPNHQETPLPQAVANGFSQVVPQG